MPSAAPFIPAAASIAGSIIGGKAAKKAAGQQVAAQQAAIDTQEKYLSPYAQAGQAGLGDLQNFVSQGANFADTQAFKDITNMARAGGQFGSGNRATALTDYYATNFRPQRMRELSFLPELGGRAAGDLAAGIGGLQQNIGTARAEGTIGKANAYASGLGSFGDLIGKYNLGDYINRGTPGFNPNAPDPRLNDNTSIRIS